MEHADRSTPYRARWWALAVLCLSLTIIGIDNTIVNVALPTLVRDLRASASELQWIVDSYVLVFAGLLLTAGALGDRFGRKLALDVGLLIFAGGSLWATFADSPETLIAGRAVMGIGGAFIMPATLSIITNVFPASERAKAIGIWAAFAGLGVVAGPVVGGWLLEDYWWGSVFLINVPIIVVALTFGAFLIPESKDPSIARLDPVGAVLSIAALGALVYAIIEAPAEGWTDGTILSIFGAAAVLIVLFIVWEMRTATPMLDMAFFRNARFSASSAAITLVFFALFGSVFVLTQYLQFVLGYSPFEAGVRMTPVAALIFSAPASAKLSMKVGTKKVVAVGLTLVSIGLYMMSTFTTTTEYGSIATALVILGLGMGATMAPATDAIMGSLPLAKAGVGSAMNDTTRMVGGALGVAAIGSVLTSAYSASLDGISRVIPEKVLANLPPQASEVIQDSVGAATAVARRISAQVDPAIGERLRDAAHAAFVDGMGTSVLVAAGVALFGAIVALVFLPAHESEVAQESHYGDDDLALGARAG
ncbi:MAG TPA: DHA2 family efflux MFS transporter permease subunit [Actinomycetota bacterium]|nr:DHA2 family efflux MFS transporter permease subunit [Actinomycetota bacterium]